MAMSTESFDWTGRAQERIERIEEHARETLDEASAIRDDIEEIAEDPPAPFEPSPTIVPDPGGRDGIDLSGGGGSGSGGTTND